MDLKEKTFRKMAEIHPELELLRQLRYSLDGLKLNDLRVGHDGFNRVWLNPFGSRTSRTDGLTGLKNGRRSIPFGTSTCRATARRCEEALYKWIGRVLEAADKDPAIKQTLEETADAAGNELISPFFQWRYNGRSAGNGWNSPVNNAQWGTDYLNRAGTAKSNMYDNRPNETKYIYRDFDSKGQQLNGKNNYARINFFTNYYSVSPGMLSITPGKGANYLMAFTDSEDAPLSGGSNYRLRLPANIPAAIFWSVTLYDAENSSGLANGQPFPSLGSRDKPAQNYRR